MTAEALRPLSDSGSPGDGGSDSKSDHGHHNAAVAFELLDEPCGQRLRLLRSRYREDLAGIDQIGIADLITVGQIDDGETDAAPVGAPSDAP